MGRKHRILTRALAKSFQNKRLTTEERKLAKAYRLKAQKRQKPKHSVQIPHGSQEIFKIIFSFMKEKYDKNKLLTRYTTIAPNKPGLVVPFAAYFSNNIFLSVYDCHVKGDIITIYFCIGAKVNYNTQWTRCRMFSGCICSPNYFDELTTFLDELNTESGLVTNPQI